MFKQFSIKAYLKKLLTKPLIFYIKFSTIVFIGSLVAGFVHCSVDEGMVDFLFKIVEANRAPGDLSALGKIWDIFSHNTYAHLFFLLAIFLRGSKLGDALFYQEFLLSIMGVVLVCIAIHHIFINGYVLGLYFYYYVSLGKFIFPIIRIAPHGMLEIPILFFMYGVSLWIFSGAIMSIWSKKSFKKRFKLSIQIFIIIVMPVYLIAAIIEVCVTPHIVKWYNLLF